MAATRGWDGAHPGFIHTLPTEDQLWQVERAWEVMEELVGPLNELIGSRVPALNARLYAEGVRPEVGEEVRVPGG